MFSLGLQGAVKVAMAVQRIDVQCMSAFRPLANVLTKFLRLLMECENKSKKDLHKGPLLYQMSN